MNHFDPFWPIGSRQTILWWWSCFSFQITSCPTMPTTWGFGHKTSWSLKQKLHLQSLSTNISSQASPKEAWWLGKKNGPRDTVTPDAVRAFLGFMGPCQVWKEYIPLLITLHSFWEVDSTFIQLILSIYFLTSLNFPPKKRNMMPSKTSWNLQLLNNSWKKSLETKIWWTPKCQGTEEFQIPPSLGIQHLVPSLRRRFGTKNPSEGRFSTNHR